MRHRAARPFLDLWCRLPRAAARPVRWGARLSPVRAAVAIVLLLGLGTTTVVAASSIHDGSAGQGARTSASGDRPEQISPSRDSSRPGLDATGSPSSGPAADAGASSSSAAGTPTPSKPSGSGPRGTDLPTQGATTALPSQPPLGDGGVGSSADGGTTSSGTPQDATPPRTSLSEEFPAGDAAVFTFSASEPASFECSLDGAAFAGCGSRATYTDLASGWHTFAVRAVDEAGNVDATPAKTRWHANGGPVGADQ